MGARARLSVALIAGCAALGIALRLALRLDREHPLWRPADEPELRVVSVRPDGSMPVDVFGSMFIDVDAQIVNAGAVPLHYDSPSRNPIVSIEAYDGSHWDDASSYMFCGNGSWTATEIRPGEVVDASGSGEASAPLLRARVWLELPDGSPLELFSAPFDPAAALGGEGLARRLEPTLSRDELELRSTPATW